MEDLIDNWTSQVGRERHVEGEIDRGIDGCGRGQRRSTMRPPQRRSGGHISMRSRYPKGRRHTFPAMTGLARKVGYLMHVARADGSRSSREDRGEEEGKGLDGRKQTEKEVEEEEDEDEEEEEKRER